MIKKFLKILLGFIIPFILFGGVFASLLLIKKDIPQNYRLRIEKGQGLASVSQQLANDNVVYSKLAVRLSGKINGLDNNIRPGSYKIPSKASTWEIVQYLKNKRPDATTVRIIEGLRFKDMRKIINENPDLRQIYRAAYKMMQTYLNEAWDGRDKDLPYKNPYELLIMASIVEKESAHESDRKDIAAVFRNRLEKGMRLQTDPTVIYGMGDAYQGNIRRKDLETDTPYNTYTRAGLTPTPIALPSKAALEAAAHPNQNDYLYFVAKMDGTNRSHFSKTLDEHNDAVRKYILKK